MELIMAVGIGIVTACAIYLLLRGRTFSMVLGLSMLSTAVNLFIFSMGRLRPGAPPIVAVGVESYADPVPQALVLTAIVIGFGMTGFVMALAVHTCHRTGSDHVDGLDPAPEHSTERGQ